MSVLFEDQIPVEPVKGGAFVDIEEDGEDAEVPS